MKAETEKQTAITNAEAEAEAMKVRAEGEAEANRILAEAEAKANKVLAESITEALTEYKKIEKWDGKLPVVSGGDGATPILDVSSITDSAAPAVTE